jgi:hypothetical protein
MRCHCNGDIDDLEFEGLPEGGCSHCPCPDMDDDDEEWGDDELAPTPNEEKGS